MSMRAFKVLLLTATIAFFAASAWADGVDPSIKIIPGGGSTATTAGLTAADPIFVYDGSGVTDWLLDNTSLPTLSPGESLSSLPSSEVYVEIIPYPGENLAYFESELWNCVTDPPITTACGALPGPQGILDEELVTPAIEFGFIGPFYQGEDIGISVPEPSTVLLLLVGLPIVFAFGFKKRQVTLA